MYYVRNRNCKFMKQKYLHTLKKYLIKLSSTGWKQSQMDVYRIRRRFPDAAYLLIQDAVYCWRPVSVDLKQDDCLHPFFIHYSASGTHSLFYFRKKSLCFCGCDRDGAQHAEKYV